MMHQRGFAPIIVLVVLLGLILLASIGSYYLLNSYGTDIGQKYNEVFRGVTAPQEDMVQEISENFEISESDDVDIIEDEIDDTDIDSSDSELDDIEASVTSL